MAIGIPNINLITLAGAGLGWFVVAPLVNSMAAKAIEQAGGGPDKQAAAEKGIPQSGYHGYGYGYGGDYGYDRYYGSSFYPSYYPRFPYYRYYPFYPYPRFYGGYGYGGYPYRYRQSWW